MEFTLGSREFICRLTTLVVKEILHLESNLLLYPLKASKNIGQRCENDGSPCKNICRPSENDGSRCKNEGWSCKNDGDRCKNEREPSKNDSCPCKNEGEPMFWVPGGGDEVGGSTTEVPCMYQILLPFYISK